MLEVVILQSVCMLVPMILVVVLCVTLNFCLSKQKQIRLQFDLTTLFILIAVLGVVWPVSKWMLETPSRDQSPLSLGFYSMFIIPVVLFVRHVIENARLSRQKRQSLKTQTVPAILREQPDSKSQKPGPPE